MKECGVNINHTQKLKRTPLYCSCYIGSLAIAKLLIEKGADVNYESHISRTALSKSCWNGEADFVELLLKQPGINLEI